MHIRSSLRRLERRIRLIRLCRREMRARIGSQRGGRLELRRAGVEVDEWESRLYETCVETELDGCLSVSSALCRRVQLLEEDRQGLEQERSTVDAAALRGRCYDCVDGAPERAVRS